MAYTDTLVSFRFLALSDRDLSRLRQLATDVKSRPSRLREGHVTGVFELTPDGDYSWLGDFISDCGVDKGEFGLFVSVSTSRDSEIVRVPEYAVALIRTVGGIVEISFTVLAGD